MKLTAADEAKLKGVHPDLVRVVKRAAMMTDRPFRVLEGVRTIERQRELVRKGASKTMNSRHLTGHAVDIVPIDDDGNVSWDWPLYYPLAKVLKAAAKTEGVAIEWGGDWVKFKDGPHWQLPWAKYPGGSDDVTVKMAAPITEKTESQANFQRVAEEGVKIASATSPLFAALAGLDWKVVLSFGLVAMIGLAAWRILPKLKG